MQVKRTLSVALFLTVLLLGQAMTGHLNQIPGTEQDSTLESTSVVMASNSTNDTDGDGIDDAYDSCPNGTSNWTSTNVTDYDSDGCRDVGEDYDDDNDGVIDAYDSCPKGDLGWTSSSITDYDSDGCKDSMEDMDDDNDGVNDVDDSCPKGELGWTSSSSTDADADGCRDSTEDADGGNTSGNSTSDDTDGDGILNANDSCPNGDTNWTSYSHTDHDTDGCQDNFEDADDDNDGVVDLSDSCPRGNLGWSSSASTDHDGDGCEDSSTEDADDDNDGISDTHDNCSKGETGWTSSSSTDADWDGCKDSTEDNDGTQGCIPGSSNIALNHSVFAQYISSSNGVYDISSGNPAHEKLKCDHPENYVYISYRSASYGDTADASSGNIAPIYAMNHLQEGSGSPKTSFGDATLNPGCGSDTCWDSFISNGANMHSSANDYSVSVFQTDNVDGTVTVTVTAHYNGTATAPSALTLYAAVTEERCVSIAYMDGSVGENCWQSWLLNNNGYTDHSGSIIGNATGFETINLSSGQASQSWTVPANLVTGGAGNMNVVAALYSNWNTTNFSADVFAAGDYTMTSYNSGSNTSTNNSLLHECLTFTNLSFDYNYSAAPQDSFNLTADLTNTCAEGVLYPNTVVVFEQEGINVTNSNNWRYEMGGNNSSYPVSWQVSRDSTFGEGEMVVFEIHPSRDNCYENCTESQNYNYTVELPFGLIDLDSCYTIGNITDDYSSGMTSFNLSAVLTTNCPQPSNGGGLHHPWADLRGDFINGTYIGYGEAFYAMGLNSSNPVQWSVTVPSNLTNGTVMAYSLTPICGGVTMTLLWPSGNGYYAYNQNCDDVGYDEMYYSVVVINSNFSDGNNTGDNTDSGNNTDNASNPCGNPSALTFSNTSSAYVVNQSVTFILTIDCDEGDDPFAIFGTIDSGLQGSFMVDWGIPGICDYCWNSVQSGQSQIYYHIANWDTNSTGYEITLTLISGQQGIQGEYIVEASLALEDSLSSNITWNFTVYGDNDSDGISDEIDNCPMVVNANQTDNDGDGLGDACDSDLDGDGVDNQNDALPNNGNETIDTDNDGLGDNTDDDDDGDGMADSADAFPLDPSEQADFDGDGVGDNLDADDDGDGITDLTDNCPLIANADQADLDGDGVGTACDGMELGVDENGTITDGGDPIPSIGMIGTAVAISAGFFIAIRREDEE